MNNYLNSLSKDQQFEAFKAGMLQLEALSLTLKSILSDLKEDASSLLETFEENIKIKINNDFTKVSEITDETLLNSSLYEIGNFLFFKNESLFDLWGVTSSSELISKLNQEKQKLEENKRKKQEIKNQITFWHETILSGDDSGNHHFLYDEPYKNLIRLIKSLQSAITRNDHLYIKQLSEELTQYLPKQ